MGFRRSLRATRFETPYSMPAFGGVLRPSDSKISGGPNWVAWLLRASCCRSPQAVLPGSRFYRYASAASSCPQLGGLDCSARQGRARSKFRANLISPRRSDDQPELDSTGRATGQICDLSSLGNTPQSTSRGTQYPRKPGISFPRSLSCPLTVPTRC